MLLVVKPLQGGGAEVAGTSAGGEVACRRPRPLLPGCTAIWHSVSLPTGPLEGTPFSFTFDEGMDPLEPAFRGNTVSGHKKTCGERTTQPGATLVESGTRDGTRVFDEALKE